MTPSLEPITPLPSGAVAESSERPRVSLWVTCTVDQFYPEVGESTVHLLRRMGVAVSFPGAQTCCGQTAFNSGFWSEARPVARRFLKVFSGDLPIVVPSGSCAAMVRVFYEDLFHDEPDVLEEAGGVAARVYELSEYLVDVLGVSQLSPAGSPEADVSRVTYHEACHLRRELGATTQARTLIRAAPGTELVEMEQAEVCCGFGGTFSVKYPDISGAMLQDKVDNIRKTGAGSVIACDSTCLMQLAGGLERQGAAVRPLHLAQLLDEATRP